ncbi:hypothetical protein [Paenibacillus sp. Soil750]|uniref:hypothetical protein n=1 Tax=Paenibacillus sp. Soil750 TaxID=1736398 RepID=UPI0006F8B5D2|nr:hypothetical protein [Paenibacillus sp. Soil750]KRE64179.1 hypothetical protein ASL11_23440 [Paenibacillus sp. Soil750]
MKIQCACGDQFVDQTDFLRNKGHVFSDQDWFDFLNAIDNAIEKSGPHKLDKERAVVNVGILANKLKKLFYSFFVLRKRMEETINNYFKLIFVSQQQKMMGNW